ncbi:MAG: WD40 repeat domain-containing protein, partial [Cyanobacteria bacterium J06649_4]
AQNSSVEALPENPGPLQLRAGERANFSGTERPPNTMIVDPEGKLINAFHSEAGPIFSAAVSGDGELIATAGVDGAVHIWERDGTFKQALIGNKSDVREIAFSPDGKLIATAGDDKVVRLWQLNGGLIKTLEGHRAAVNKLTFSPDGQQLLSASEDQTLRLWQVKETQHQILAGHGDAIRQIAFNDHGQLFSTAVDRWFNVWQQQEKQTDNQFLPFPVQQIIPGEPHPTGLATYDRETAIAFEHGKIKIWKSLSQSLPQSSRKYEIQQTLQTGAKVQHLTYSPGGAHLIVVTRDNSIKLWQRESSGEFPTIPTTTSKPIEGASSAAFSPDSDLIAVGSNDHSLTLLKADGSLIKTINGHSSGILSVAFSPDGQWIAIASKNRTLHRWRLDQLLEDTFEIDENDVFAVQSTPIDQIAFSADSQMLISALADGTLSVWEASTGELLRTLWGHESALSALAVNSEGSLVASAGRDRKIILWNLPAILAQDEVTAACEWVADYLTHNPEVADYETLCSESAAPD